MPINAIDNLTPFNYTILASRYRKSYKHCSQDTTLYVALFIINGWFHGYDCGLMIIKCSILGGTSIHVHGITVLG